MINHLSLRIAWHDDGWNGRVCQDPKANIYCIGQRSYPGDLIKRTLDLDWETQDTVAGCDCSALNQIPACTFSINAFSTKTLKSRIDPPEWLKDTSEPIHMDLPAATEIVRT